MGADDSNEGHGAGECVEHVWEMTGAVFALSGAQLEHECGRCGATMVETEATLNPGLRRG